MSESRHGKRRARLSADERRRQIVHVTASLISQRGFWGLSTQDVADECGITVPGLLHHFGSKTSLLLEVLADRDGEDAAALAAELEQNAPPDGASAIRHLCAAIVRRNLAVPEMVRLFAVLQGEALTPSHPAHEFFLERGRMAVATMTTMAAEVSDDPESLARQVIAMLDGLMLQWLRQPDAVDLVATWDAAADSLFGTVEEEAREAIRIESS